MTLTPTSALFQAVPRDGLAVAADVSIVVIGVAILVLSLVGIALVRKVSRTLDNVRTGVNQNLGPVSDRARAISDNVEFITQALRTDVERLNASVRALTDRLHQASDRMEERIEEFNALMEVVQEEAEEIFIDTAATVRGVRESAAAIGRGRETPADAEPPTASSDAQPPEEVPAAEPELEESSLVDREALPAGES